MKKVFVLTLFCFLLTPTLVLAVSSNEKTVSPERQQFQSKVQELKAAKAENKEALKTQLLSKAKTLATKSIDKIIAKYNHFLDVVFELPNISDENKADFRTKVENEIASLKAKKADVAAASTVSEVKAVMETVKAQVKISTEITKLLVLEIKKTHLSNIAEKLNAIVARLEAKSTTINVTDENSQAAKDSLTSAKGYIASARSDISAGLTSEAKDKLQKAKDELVKVAQFLENNNVEGEVE